MVSDGWFLSFGCKAKCLNPCCNGRWSLTIENWYLNIVGSLNPCCNGRWSLTMWGQSECKYLIISLNPCCNGRWSLTSIWIKTPSHSILVLILVVMEDGLWRVRVPRKKVVLCLNPCCNGRWSLTHVSNEGNAFACLNPCCNGRWSLTKTPTQVKTAIVLILVVMEDGLWHSNYERAQRVSLNPCCNGRWSLTRFAEKRKELNTALS